MCVSGIMSALRQECKWSYIMCVSGIMSALYDRIHSCLERYADAYVLWHDTVSCRITHIMYDHAYGMSALRQECKCVRIKTGM